MIYHTAPMPHADAQEFARLLHYNGHRWVHRIGCLSGWVAAPMSIKVYRLEAGQAKVCVASDDPVVDGLITSCFELKGLEVR